MSVLLDLPSNLDSRQFFEVSTPNVPVDRIHRATVGVAESLDIGIQLNFCMMTHKSQHRPVLNFNVDTIFVTTAV